MHTNCENYSSEKYCSLCPHHSSKNGPCKLPTILVDTNVFLAPFLEEPGAEKCYSTVEGHRKRHRIGLTHEILGEILKRIGPILAGFEETDKARQVILDKAIPLLSTCDIVECPHGDESYQEVLTIVTREAFCGERDQRIVAISIYHDLILHTMDPNIFALRETLNPRAFDGIDGITKFRVKNLKP